MVSQMDFIDRLGGIRMLDGPVSDVVEVSKLPIWLCFFGCRLHSNIKMHQADLFRVILIP